LLIELAPRLDEALAAELALEFVDGLVDASVDGCLEGAQEVVIVLVYRFKYTHLYEDISVSAYRLDDWEILS
jgi:hypothetical protein